MQTFIHWPEGGSNTAPTLGIKNKCIFVYTYLKSGLWLTLSFLTGQTFAQLGLDYSDIAEGTPLSFPHPHYFEGLFSALPILNCKTKRVMIWKHIQHLVNNLNCKSHAMSFKLTSATKQEKINRCLLHLDEKPCVLCCLFWQSGLAKYFLLNINFYRCFPFCYCKLTEYTHTTISAVLQNPLCNKITPSSSCYNMCKCIFVYLV